MPGQETDLHLSISPPNRVVHNKEKQAQATESQSPVVSFSNLQYQHRLGQSSAPDPSSGKEAALCFAATTGNQEHVKILLDQGSGDRRRTPPVDLDIVHLAAEAGQDQIIQLLLDTGFQAESWRSNTINGVPIMESPIQLAAANGHEGAVRVLLENGANVNSRHPDCPRQYPPLHLAAVAGHLGVVLLLVEQGADVSAESSSGMTALHLAAHSGRHLVASVLLRNGADPNRRCSKTGMTGRQITPPNTKTRQKIATLQISSQTEVEGLNANDGDHTSNSQDLLADKDVEEHEPWEGGTPLHFAAISGHTELVSMLLENGTDPNIGRPQAVEGGTPLHFATRNGHIAIVELLLNAGADVNCRSCSTQQYQYAPLHVAIMGQHSNIVSLLISKGADVNCRDGTANRYTPLRLARIMGNEEIAQILIEHGAQDDTSTQTQVVPGEGVQTVAPVKTTEYSPLGEGTQSSASKGINVQNTVPKENVDGIGQRQMKIANIKSRNGRPSSFTHLHHAIKKGIKGVTHSRPAKPSKDAK
ncbi:hypothetical protein VTJ04DRAFT_10508 [Mycothermus thermophilus]|uniref:uncharacterized protein n=1 Tax=Humicola insolens TaxID=85995 RepID=UPI003743C486